MLFQLDKRDDCLGISIHHPTIAFRLIRQAKIVNGEIVIIKDYSYDRSGDFDNDCVKEPLTLEDITRRVEFYHHTKPHTSQLDILGNCHTSVDFNPEDWYLSLQMSDGVNSIHEEHGTSEFSSPDEMYEDVNRCMPLFRNVTKSATNRIRLSLRR